jgi:hypothetical protein
MYFARQGCHGRLREACSLAETQPTCCRDGRKNMLEICIVGFIAFVLGMALGESQMLKRIEKLKQEGK